MTITIEQVEGRVTRLEADEEGLRSEFRETLGTMHEVLGVHKSMGHVHSALRATQLEHGKKLQEHSFLLSGLVAGQRRLESDVAELKTDVAELKTDVAGLKSDVAELKTDVAGLKTDVAELKTNVAMLKVDMVYLTQLVRKGFGLPDEE